VLRRKGTGAAIVLAVVVLPALTGAVGPAPATHLGYKPCPDMRLRRVNVSTVRSNFSCRRTRVTLRTLLARGVGGLPKPTTRIGRWGCRATGYKRFHSCEQRRAGDRTPLGVLFSVRARHRAG
jgi:hypothetical protein